VVKHQQFELFWNLDIICIIFACIAYFSIFHGIFCESHWSSIFRIKFWSLVHYLLQNLCTEAHGLWNIYGFSLQHFSMLWTHFIQTTCSTWWSQGGASGADQPRRVARSYQWALLPPIPMKAKKHTPKWFLPLDMWCVFFGRLYTSHMDWMTHKSTTRNIQVTPLKLTHVGRKDQAPYFLRGPSCHRRVDPHMVTRHPQSSPPPFSSQHTSKHKCSGSPPPILWSFDPKELDSGAHIHHYKVVPRTSKRWTPLQEVEKLHLYLSASRIV